MGEPPRIRKTAAEAAGFTIDCPEVPGSLVALRTVAITAAAAATATATATTV